MGVAYYANYFVWFEVARTELLRTLGWSYREMETSGVFLPVIDAHCEYKRSARYDDAVEIETNAAILSPVRMEFTYVMTIAGDPTPAAIGRTEHAATDADGKPCRLPDRIRSLFQ